MKNRDVTAEFAVRSKRRDIVLGVKELQSLKEQQQEYETRLGKKQNFDLAQGIRKGGGGGGREREEETSGLRCTINSNL